MKYINIIMPRCLQHISQYIFGPFFVYCQSRYIYLEYIFYVLTKNVFYDCKCIFLAFDIHSEIYFCHLKVLKKYIFRSVFFSFIHMVYFIHQICELYCEKQPLNKICVLEMDHWWIVQTNTRNMYSASKSRQFWFHVDYNETN